MRTSKLARLFLSVALLVPWLFLAGQARADRSAQTLERAIRMFDDGQDAGARSLLLNLLAQKPKAKLASRAHVFLGLIALNSIDSDEASAQFAEAIQIDPTVELPVSASPKAEPLFRRARRTALNREPTGASAEEPSATRLRDVPPPAILAPPPPTRARVPDAEPAPEPPTRSHLAAYITGGVGVAALGTGTVFWVLQQETRNQITDSHTSFAKAESLQHLYSNQYLFAEGFFWGGVGLLGVAGTLFLIDKLLDAHPSTTVTVSPTPGGGALNLSGSF